MSRPALGPTTAYYPIGTGGSFLREKVLMVPTIADINVELFLYLSQGRVIIRGKLR
jgi:hypothetical protein